MLKKYLSYLGIIVFACFSFYYTDKAVDIVKRNDPVMKDIINNKKDYSVKSVNATIEEDEIIPGINGLEVDINKSYKKMKESNEYNSDMLVLEEVIPQISFIKEYDKYIVSGNPLKNEIALVFKVDDIDYIEDIDSILLDKNILATFFIDGNTINNNIEIITNLINSGYELENLGKYTSKELKWANNLIYSLTNKDPKYCYVDFKTSDVIKLCSKNKMYTIKPTIGVTNYPFLTVKNNLKPGSIISFNINSETVKELPSIITYIKQKGYTLVTLDQLINEKYYSEK